MDIDISDILADVSRPLPTISSHHATSSASYDPDRAYTDHILLTRHWTSERSTPHLLPYPTQLLDRVMARIQQQIMKIEDLAAGTDSGSYTNGRTTTNAGRNINLVLSILQTDLSRTQYLVRSVVRCRLGKITKHAAHYQSLLSDPDPSQHTTASDSKTRLLSPSEEQFLQKHQTLLQGLYGQSFLNTFPPKLRRLDDRSGGGIGSDQGSMVEGPNGQGVVVVRCLVAEWDNEDEVRRGLGGEGGGGGAAGNELRMRGGEVWVGRWADVRTGAVRGDLELL